MARHVWSDSHVSLAGLLSIAASSALFLCVCGYALDWAGGGTAAGIAALLLSSR